MNYIARIVTAALVWMSAGFGLWPAIADAQDAGGAAGSIAGSPVQRMVVVVSSVDRSPLRDELIETAAGMVRGLCRRASIDPANVTVLVPDQAFADAMDFRPPGSDANDGTLPTVVIGDRETILNTFATADPADRFWTVVLGYATHRGGYRLHVPDVDVTGKALVDAIDSVDAKSKVTLWLTPCSGGRLRGLSAPGHVIITATDSDDQINGTRMGAVMASVLDDAEPIEDFDGDKNVTLLDAYCASCRTLLTLYATDELILTEHAVIDDNGDRRGTAVQLRHIEIPQTGEPDDTYPIDSRPVPSDDVKTGGTETGDGFEAATIIMDNNETL